MSYAGAMGFGFTTARSAVPDARELSAALEAALHELVAASRSKARKAGARVAAAKRSAPRRTAKRTVRG
jgi:hypothetical protein